MCLLNSKSFGLVCWLTYIHVYVSVQEEKTERDIVIPRDVTENRDTDEHLEKASLSDNQCGSNDETSPELPSSNNDSRKNALISSKKTTECSSSVENTSGVSISSVSNAIISGILPQPTSRRQTFITLEKFDGSENRPFSPSALNNMSSTVTVKNNQEVMDKIDNPPKAKKREMALEKSDAEKIAHGIKRSSRRSSKAEQTGNKRSKLLRSDQEKNTQESIDGTVVLENNPPGLLNQTECVLDNQAHLSESTMEDEDTMLKPTIENAVLLENSTVEEKTLGISLESKENTPPAIKPADQMVDEDSPVQITPNQKTLRRSSRRRSEIAEPTPESQEKENNHQKKDRRKEEEKTLQKSPLHVKDDVLPKQKLIAEQTLQENLIDKGNNLHEKTFGETSTTSEIDESKKKLDLENIKSEGDSAQDIVDKSSEKPVSGRTRYQTRRASQGLLSSIENSESDSSEAKEESSKKKRSGKWKSKSNDSVDIEDQEEKVIKQECVNVENQTLDYKANSEVGRDLKPQICEQKDENTVVTLKDSTVSSDVLQVSDDVSTADEGKSKTNKCTEYSVSDPSVPDSNLRTRNASKRLQKRDSIENNMGESSKIGTSDNSLLSEKTLQTLECQHKRSRRVRRSKGCDCCGEKSQPQEKFIGLKSTENYDIKASETKKTDTHTPVTVSETSKANLCSEVKLLDEHNCVNFHLGLKEENDAVNDSLIISESELKENTSQNPLPSGVVNFEEETCDMDSEEATPLESQEPSNKKCRTVSPCLGDSKDNSLECSILEIKEEKSEAVLEKELSIENIVNVETDACKANAKSNPEVEAIELGVKIDKSEASFSEQESTETGISEEEVMEINSDRSDESDAEAAEKLKAEEAVTEEFNSVVDHYDNTTEMSAVVEIPEQTAVGELDERSDESGPGSSEGMNAEMETCEETVIGEVSAEADQVNETEGQDSTNRISTKPVQAETETSSMEVSSFVLTTLGMSTEEGKDDSNETETKNELSKSEEAVSADSQMVGNDEILQEAHHTSEKVEDTSQSLTSETAISELITEDNNASPQKLRELDPLLVSANGSPSGMQTRCVWSPLASPSTSILKRGLKRPQEDEISSPVHKVGELRLNIT